MSDDREPPAFSDRDLTLRTIELSYQRARAFQQTLASRTEQSEAADGTTEQSEAEDELEWPPPLDEAEQTELPNPIVTDATFHHHLLRATRFQGDAATEAGRGRLSRIRAAIAHHLDQVRFNGATVDALHQLDHRTRAQDRVIRRLEAELAEARRALAAIERGGGHR